MKNVFAIYASEDEVLVLYLMRHLKALERDYNVSIWHDDPIYPGQAWKPQDASRIHRTDIFLFMVSKAFMYSEFVKQPEFKMVIDRYKQGMSMIIPILLDNCPWNIDFKSKDYNFTMKELQVFPQDGRPVSDYKSEDEIVMRITEQVKRRISSYDQYQMELKFAEEKKNLLEEAEVQRRVEQEIKLREEAQALKKVEEERKLRDEIEARIRAEEEQRIREAAEEAARKAEQEIKLREEAAAKEKAEEEQRLREAAEEARKVEQEIKLREEAEAKKKAEEEQRLREAAEEAARKAEQEIKLREEAAAKKMAEEEQRLREAAEEAARKAEQEIKLREEAEAKKKAEAEQKLREETEAARKTEQEIKLREEAQAKKKAEEEQWFVGESEVKEKAEEEQWFVGETEIKEKTEEEQWFVGESEAKEKPEEEQWFVRESEAKEKAEDEKWFVGETETENQAEQENKVLAKGKAVVEQSIAAEVQPKKRTAKKQQKLPEESRKLRLLQEDNRLKKSKKAIKAREEEWRKFKEEADAKRNREIADEQEYTAETDEIFDETSQTKNTSPRRRKLVVLLIAALAIVGVWIFSEFDKESDEPTIAMPKTEATDMEGAGAVIKPETEAENQTNIEEVDNSAEPATETADEIESLSNLEVGKTFGEGIIFTIDASGTTGTIAFSQDVGPMTWENAMKIHEQLGEGWRLPTMDELEIMYQTIGQGADNTGRFADELYWSATPYDPGQARLLRFSDGNTSYHYNKVAPYREFLARPVRDFKR